MDANTRVSNNGKGRKNQQKVVERSIAVSNAEWLKDYVLKITFNDDTEQVVDFGPYLSSHSHPYIDPFKDSEQFKSFYIDGGNLVWGADWNMIFPTWKLYQGYLDV